jgi:hypothetical protein
MRWNILRLSCIDDDGKAGRGQHDGRRGAGRIGGARDGNAAIRLFQRRCVIHAIAGHADHVAVLLQNIHDMEFVLGKHLGKSVGILDQFDFRRRLLALGISQVGAIENIGAHAERLRGFPGDRQGVAGHHLDFHAHLARRLHRGFRVRARRIVKRQHAQQLPLAIGIRPRHAKRAEAARGEIVDRFLIGRPDRIGIGCELQNDLGGALGDFERLAVGAFDRRFRTFMHRIEWREMQHMIRLEAILVGHSGQHRLIDRVVVVRTRGQCAVQDNLCGRNALHRERVAQRKLGQFLDGDELADDGLFPGEQTRADGHGDRQYRRHGNGNRRHG